MPTSRETTRRVAVKGATRVGEVMVTGVVAAHEDAVFKEIADALVRNGVSAVPVVDAQHRVIGVVSIVDLVNWTISAQSETISQLENYISGAYPG